MEKRVQPPRLAKHRVTPESEPEEPKKRGKKVTEASSSASSVKTSAKKPLKSKTDDDIMSPASSMVPTKKARRSKSAEPVSKIKKKKTERKPLPVPTVSENDEDESEDEFPPAIKVLSKVKASESSGSESDNEPKTLASASKKKTATSKAAKKEEIPAKQSTKKDAVKKLLNNVDTDYSNINFGIKEKFNFKIASWNVAGLRALVKKNPDYFTREDADVVCMTVSFNVG